MDASDKRGSVLYHRTLRYHAHQMCIQSFGSWLEPRYIFAARPLN